MSKKRRPTVKDPSLQITFPRSAGIDVHANEHWVCVPAALVPDATPNRHESLSANVRRFGGFTSDLEAIAEFLQECHIETVAMESTGVYWIPLHELLESRGFHVVLVNPVQTRQVAGRPKSDVRDCQWIQRLHSYGLLTPSFRPDDQTCILRSYVRQRQMLIAAAARCIQHMQKALEQMNIKLTEVLADIVGATGLMIIQAILDGERDPKKLAKFRHRNCHAKEDTIAAALQGNWREEHLWALRQALQTYEHLRRQLQECDQRILSFLQARPDQSDGRPLEKSPRRTDRRVSDAPEGTRELLFRWTGQDATQIEGVNATTALTVLSETGVDMSKWPTERHFTSWLGLCPQVRSSAGRIKSRRVRGGASRAAAALRMAGQGCHHAKNAMGAFYRRIQARSGGRKAITATARKIAIRIYRLHKFGEAYVRQGMAEYETKWRRNQARGLARRAAELGYKLTPMDAEPAGQAS